MEENKRDIEAYLDAGEVINIPVYSKGKIQRLLIKLKIRKPQILTYTLRRIRTGNRERIALRVMKLPKEIYNDSSVIRRAMELSADHTTDLIYCAAVALQNDNEEPKEKLIDALRWIDDEFLFEILEKSLTQFDVVNFFNSIVLISGVESLTMRGTR